MLHKTIALSLLCLTTAACGSRSDTDDDGGMPPTGDLFCPASEGHTVCDLKLVGGQRQPNLMDPITLNGVVVTTPTQAVSFDMMGTPTLAGFFVQDRTTSEDLADRYSGIAVTYRIGEAQVPPVGSIVNLEGTYEEFSRDGSTPQKQVKATFVSEAMGNEAVRVKEIGLDDLDPAYEGTVLRINDVVATAINPAGAGMNQIFGFEVNQKLIVSRPMDGNYFSRVGEEFNSITGVYRVGTFNYDAGIFTLVPRTEEDIKPKNPISTVTSISAVQDPSSPDKPADMCSSDQPQMDRRCPRIQLTDVVVTAAGGYVSSNLRALWVQDPSVADGRFAGIKVVYGADDTGIPSVGDLINLRGEVIDWYDGLQVQYPDFSPGSGSMTPTPVVVDPSDIPRTADPATNPYEGVLVQLQDVQVTQACVEDDMNRDHGNWIVAGDVLIGTAFFYDYNGDLRPSGTQCDNQPDGNCSCAAMSRPNDQRALDDSFQSITGVIDYSFNDFRLNPRGNDDLVGP